ncbi:MAG: helix-turn-helix domain-containing protein [Sphingomonadales bacterium]|nr:helix-turn-helix domain-containing protein [Sphingomonadales bacterium]
MSNHLISITYKRVLGSGTRKALMVLFADKASDDGRGIYASKQTMADELDLSKQTVISTIKGLIDDGLLSEVGERACDTGHTVEYAINVDALIALPLVEYEKRRAERAEARKRASPVKKLDRSTDLTATGQTALPKPLSKPFTPQTPHSGQSDARDGGDQYWRTPPGKSWADVGQMLRKLEGKPERRSRRDQPLPASNALPAERKSYRPVRAKARETDQSAIMHAALRRDMGSTLYEQWLQHAAMIYDAPGAIVVVSNQFQQTWIEDRFRPKLLRAARQAFGDGVSWVRVQVDQHG